MAPKKAAAAPAAAKAKPEAKAKPKPKPKKEEPVEREEDKIPTVSPPDDKAYAARLEEVNNAIEKLEKQKEQKQAIISERSGGSKEYNDKRAELRAELDHWTKKIEECKSKKEDLNQLLDQGKQEAIQRKSEVGKLKKEIGYKNEDEIDKRIAQIEYSMSHESLSLKQEKEYMKEMSQLKKNRPNVSKVNALEAELKNPSDMGGNTRDKIKGLKEEMDALFTEKKKVSERLKALNDERASQTGGLTEIQEAKTKIIEELQKKKAERTSIRAELKQEQQNYYEYQQKVRAIRQERAREERDKRQADYKETQKKKRAEKLEDQPYVAEITLIEQTLLFCRGLITSKGGDKEEKKEQTDFGLPDGTVVLKKKGEDEEYYFAPTKAKTQKGKKSKSEGSSKAIKHNAETFRLFDQLKLDAPITTDDVPPLIEKLEAQLENYQNKVKEWRETLEEKKKKIMESEDGMIDEDEKEDKDEKEEAKEEEAPAAAEEAAKEEEADAADKEEEE